ncbi:BA75_04556T0 [Komagataella pastoris]|uniref:Golgi apparatus membrane protein TVP38 n=1 Tax=Komagataella pastoris TaxID=4922 RepID=A0A1B2JIG3_PICPA|nr:BA75_04556T0 [Komagataella pastoris]
MHHQGISLDEDLDRGFVETAKVYGSQLASWYQGQPIWKKALIVSNMIVLSALGVLALVYHERLLSVLQSMGTGIKDLKYGWLMLFGLVYTVAFPPLIGYAMLSTLCGMVYGISFGWPLLMTSTVLGSLSSFLVFRYLLHDYSVRLVESHSKLKAITAILTGRNNWKESLFILSMIRLCPLPYSLSNGALAAVPGLSSAVVLGASVLTSPKLLIPLFIGSKINNIGDAESTGWEKIVDLLSIFITSTAFTTTTYVIYYKMQQQMNTMDLENGDLQSLNTLANFDDDAELVDDDDLTSTI